MGLACELALTQGMVALVDEIDFPLINKHKWRAHPGLATYYAVTGHRNLRMHRIILSAPAEMMVDHRNGNGLDNRRCNLRLCTRSQNAVNSAGPKGGSSQYKGVYWSKQKQRWIAEVRCNDRKYRIGRFRNEQEAARAYDEAALRLFGEFARLNFPLEAQPCS